mmetsp:Transcript_41886/g.89246  ORF Transcript_41886/g.89246 Transcript_41886/m.89246 type:complete len:264 (+) Transcript_41886:584-1375(+)
MALELLHEALLELSESHGAIASWAINDFEGSKDVIVPGDKKLEQLEHIVWSIRQSRPPHHIVFGDLTLPEAVSLEELFPQIVLFFLKRALIVEPENTRGRALFKGVPAPRHSQRQGVDCSIFSHKRRVPDVAHVPILSDGEIDQDASRKALIMELHFELKLRLLRLNIRQKRQFSQPVADDIQQVGTVCESNAEDLLIVHVSDSENEEDQKLGTVGVLREEAKDAAELHGGQRNLVGNHAQCLDFGAGDARRLVHGDQYPVQG